MSSRMPGFEDTFTPVANQHAFMEFEIDRTNQALIEKWVYTDGPEWAPLSAGAASKPTIKPIIQ